MSGVQIVRVEPHSDGDASHLPKPDWKLVDTPHLYLEKLATQWMQSQGRAKPGVKYYLDKLPEGYRLYEKLRTAGQKHLDRHLYGHPKHKYFDSPNRFYPHFEHLMKHGSSLGCSCTICAATGSVPLPIGSNFTKPTATSVPRPLPKFPPKIERIQYVDEEEVPDVVRHLIDKLKIQGSIDRPIEENMSMDWRAERELLPTMLESTPKQPSWVPRLGEIVLFVRDIDGEIAFHEGQKDFQVFKADEAGFAGHPNWEAGVVTQVADESLQLQDLLAENGKSMNVSYSGFRVEPLPDPNDTDKGYTKQYKYVPLHHIRPFVFWQIFLKGTPEQRWHQTIKNALKVSASVSVVEKYRFKGTWPNATIFCRGIYLGSELITVGDVIRLMPSEPETEGRVVDVLHVQSIKLKFTNLDKASSNDDDEGHPYNSTVHLTGKAYTVAPRGAWASRGRSNGTDKASMFLLPDSAFGYDDLEMLHDPSKTYQTSFTRVLGRCFSADAMLLWFPSFASEPPPPTELLTHGLEGVIASREFSSSHDKRILSGKSWFWGDTRSESLGVETLNATDVASHDVHRKEDLLDEWRKGIRVLERVAGPGEREGLGAFSTGRGPGRPRKSMAPPVATDTDDKDSVMVSSESALDSGEASGMGV